MRINLKVESSGEKVVKLMTQQNVSSTSEKTDSFEW